MISGNLKIIDLFGIVLQPETIQSEGTSPSLENTGQEFAGMFAEVVNGLVPQTPVLQLPIVDNSADGEVALSTDIAVISDKDTDQNILNSSNVPVTPNFLFSANKETVDFINENGVLLPVLPGSKFPLNKEIDDLLIQSKIKLPINTLKTPLNNFDFTDSPNFEVRVDSSVTKMPLITINGKELADDHKIQEAPSPLLESDLLNRLNLKEIHITQEKGVDDSIELERERNFRPTSVQIPKIELSDALIALKSPVSKTESNQNAADNSAKVLVIGQDMNTHGNQPDFDNNFTQARSQALIELINNESEQFPGKMDKGDKAEPVLDSQLSPSQSKIEQNVNIESKIWNGKEADSQAAGVKTNPPVRVIIPESARQLTAHQKNSIMIKIEPEHLGPARLDLQMKNEALTARLTVESTVAKTTLEHSINTLKEQLAKVDIKVEQIEINVRGETNYNQLFNRQPQWQKFDSAHQARFDADDLPETLVPVNQIYNFRQNQYVGSTGVNVLA